MSHHALIEKPEQETIYQTEHFEAIPYGDKYALVHRGSKGHFACGREFPAEVARIAVEAMEAGFFHGVEALQKSLAKDFPGFLRTQESSLGRSMLVHELKRRSGEGD